MYKKGAGNDKQGKDAGNRTLCPYRSFSQAIRVKEALKRGVDPTSKPWLYNLPSINEVEMSLMLGVVSLLLSFQTE